MELPAHIPWPVYRVATSGRFHASPHEVLTRWSLAELFDACDVLDALEDAAARAAREV